jgi:adenosylcobinamide-phosphate synthase
MLIFGGVLVVSGALLFSLPLRLVGFMPPLVASLLAVPLLKSVFSIGTLLKAGEEVLGALERGDLPEARRLLSWNLVSRGTDDLSEEEVVGATAESLAENLTDSLASPLFFYALFGLPGAFFYRFCNTCDSMIGYRGGETEWGGKIAARLDDILNWIPARVTAMLLLAAGVLADEDAIRGAEALRDQRRNTESPNAGWTMSVMAGLLSVTLEKRGQYSLAGGSEPLCTQTLRRCLKVTRVAAALILACAAVLGGLHAVFR